MLTSAVLAAACTLMAAGALPDHRCTRGRVQSTSTQAVCTPGWASRRHVTAATRALVYRRYGLRGPHPFPEWEIDHRVPLELGGSNAITNLWPEHHQTKDRLENRLHDRVCAQETILKKAQRIFEGTGTATNSPAPAPRAKRERVFSAGGGQMRGREVRDRRDRG